MKLEYLYRCPVCKIKKAESEFVVDMECSSDDGGIMQYLGDQPAGTGALDVRHEEANKRAEQLDRAEILATLRMLEEWASEAGHDTTEHKALISRIVRQEALNA